MVNQDGKRPASRKRLWKITEKLSRLVEGKRLADVARLARIKPTQVRDYTVKGAPPRYDIALKLAHALNVPADWLLDDAKNFPAPPPQEKISPSDLSDRELMLEIARRFRIDFVAVIDALDQIDMENWAQIRQNLAAWREGEPMPPEAQRVRPIVDAIENATAMQLRYSPTYFALANHNILPGKEKPPESFDPARYDERFRELQDKKDFLEVYSRISRAIHSPGNPFAMRPEFKDGSRWAGSSPPSPGQASPPPVSPALATPPASSAAPASSPASPPGIQGAPKAPSKMRPTANESPRSGPSNDQDKPARKIHKNK